MTPTPKRSAEQIAKEIVHEICKGNGSIYGKWGTEIAIKNALTQYAVECVNEVKEKKLEWAAAAIDKARADALGEVIDRAEDNFDQTGDSNMSAFADEIRSLKGAPKA